MKTCNQVCHPAWDILKKINNSMLRNKEWLISVNEQLASCSNEKIQSVACHAGHTWSHMNNEAKQHCARIVLRLETTW